MNYFVLFLLLTGAAATATPRSVKPVSLRIEQPADSLSAYVGKYNFAQNGYFTTATVMQQDGELYAEIDAYGKNKLIKQKDADTYQSTSSYGSIFVFKRDAAGNVTGLLLRIQGNEVEATKAKMP